MKTVVFAAALLVSVSSFAAQSKIILDCNLSFGPDQQVTVRSVDGGLVLEELTSEGSMVRRPLTAREFVSKKLKLRVESPLDSGTMKLTSKGWYYDIGGAQGYADCR